MNIQRTNRTAWLGLGVVLLIALAGFSMIGMGHGPMAGYGERPSFGAGPWFWGFGLVGLVVRLAIWAGLILLGMRLFRRMAARSAWDDRSDYEASPLEILKRRYAAGEISREQFEEMRRVLLDPNTSGSAPTQA